tara:strand:+ start:79 stop:384 length:306 start_codon:yes stop_codon:yes gene_type:complete
MKSLDILEKFKCSTAIRITALKGLNMHKNDIDGFARLIERSGCSEVEVKGYMNVGFSTSRLSEKNMPSFNEVKEFSEKLADIMSYKIKDEVAESRVTLLSK